MYKKALSLFLASVLVVGLWSVDMSPKFSYAETLSDNENVATSSNAKRYKDKQDDSDDIEVATNSNASRKEQDDEQDIPIATSSNATIATSSEAKQDILNFEKVIKDIRLLKQEDYSIVSEENPIYIEENLILRFEYKLKSSVKKDLSEGNDIVYEYQLPEDVLNLIGNYSNLVGETFSDTPDLETLGYTGEFCKDGQILITLLSTDDTDDFEKFIDIPLTINTNRENLPDKISFPASNTRKITVHFYVGFDYEENIDGVTIRITSIDSTLSKNITVKISKVNQDDELEKILRDSIEGFKKDETIAFDISFWDGDNEIRIDDGSVEVSFIYPELSENGEAKVFHIDDNDNLEIVPCIQYNDEISFEANHFSVYGFTTTYTQDTDPLGNPLIGGTTSGDWKGNCIYFGWEGLESNKSSGNDNWLQIKDYINNNEFYRLNGQLYSGADLMTPIKWRILNNNGSALLLLSDEMLDVYNYGTGYNSSPTWETSDIRRWLNAEFMKNHFTPEEQDDIKESTVTDIVAPDSNLPEGNTTDDKIFLPSKEELTEEDYGFPVNGESLSRKTTYNNDSLKNRNTAGDISYWTRSRGDLNYTLLRPVFVTDKGLCGYGANRYCSWILGVRPMFRLDLNSQRYGLNKTDNSLSAGIKFDKSTLEMKVGDIKALDIIPINIDDSLTNLKWMSTEPSVVSLGSDNKLSALSNGTANIYAIQGQYIAMCRVTVKENPKQQHKVIFKDGDTIVREVMVEDGMAADAPTITKDGYTLTWDKDFRTITEDTVINAIWVGKTYNIIYEMNNGTNNSLNPGTYTTGVGAILQRPTYTGHVFGGWYTTSDFKEGTEIVLIAPKQFGNITVYAKWYVSDYRITYNLSGGTNHKLNPETYTFGVGVTLKDPTANGAIFKGWYTTSDFKEGTSIISIDSKTSGDIMLYAKWELCTYDITYVLNGGVNHVSNPAKYKYGDGVIFENPTYDGYTFEGWYLTRDFKNGTNITFLNLTNTGNVTIYAKWKKIETGNSSGGGHSSSGGGSVIIEGGWSYTKNQINDLYFNSEAMLGFILPIGNSVDLNEYLIIDTTQENEIELNWKSSDESIVTVQNGIISCRKDGFANVSVSPKYDNSKVARVLVRSVAPRVNDPTREPVDNYHYNTGMWVNYPMPNCTAYAWGRAFEIIGIEPGLSINNASRWEEYNNSYGGIYKSGSEPRIFSVACLTRRNHVQVVENIVNINDITSSNAMQEWINNFNNYKYDTNRNVVIFSQSAASGYGSGINYFQVNAINFGGGVNTLNFVYGPQTGWPNNDPIDKYLYLDLSPYIEETTKTTEVTNNSAKIKTRLKNIYHDSDLKTEGYYIGKKRSQLSLGKENAISCPIEVEYQLFSLEANTTYYYQFFLKGLNGIEYRGNIYEFTTHS